MTMDIDDFFKKPNLPMNKRKAEDSLDRRRKNTKINPNGDAKSYGEAIIENEEEDDVMAGPDLPPDEDNGEPEDDEGRFFGGGITNETAEVLNFIDERDKDELGSLEKIDSTWVRKLALNFEKKISKNAELRAKFENNPQKFMASEADLDADIKALSILSEHSNLYEEFAKLGCVGSLVSLLSHENTDIAIDAIEVINELTDEDIEAEQAQWDALVDAMIESDMVSLLYDNISRLNEENESDRAGVYHVLGVLENLSSRASIAELIGRDTLMIQWLLSRIQKSEKSISQNKQYSTEVLAILLQSSTANITRLVELDGIDTLLQLLSPYRKRDPAKVSEEEEYVENLFDCIICCVDDREGKEKFLAAEGIELCLIMLREGKMSKPRALRLLDHALGGPDGAACCERLVEAVGLKTTFTMFMKKHDAQTTEHLLGLLASMLRSLPSTSDARIRLLAKFVEKDYQKLERLMTIRREYATKMSMVDQAIGLESANLSSAEQQGRADEWLSRRLDAGLFSLQTVDVIIAWLAAEDTGARKKLQSLLADRDESFQDVKATIQQQLDGMNASAEEEDSVLKDMLATLIEHL